MIPTKNLTPIIIPSCLYQAGFESKIGTASSLVARKTAKRVPRVIARFENRSAITAENPHWGTIPRSEPNKGPNHLLFFVKNLYGSSLWWVRYENRR